MNKREILLVYDHRCSVCDSYCRKVQISDTAGTLRLVDAREDSPVMDAVTAKGLDIDQGMVLKVEDTLYYGSDAIHELSLLSSQANLFNWLTYWTFRSSGLSHVIYPILRFAHNLLLKTEGKTKINNLKRPGNDRF